MQPGSPEGVHDPPGTDRRAFVGGLALLGSGGAFGLAPVIDDGRRGQRRSDGAAGVTVLTWNCYLGVDLARLFRARSMDDVRRIAGRMLEDVERRPFPPRADAIAAAIATARPDVVCLQEAAIVRTQADGDVGGGGEPNAGETVVDFLDVLLGALGERGAAYEVAASTVTTDFEVPADVDGRAVDVRLTDRDALLVREGVDVGGSRTGTYEASLEVPVEGTVVSIDRGYAATSVSVGDLDVAVATTHLEPASTAVRLRQARELLDTLPPDGPAVVAGDLNSGPGGSLAAHRLLTASLRDAHVTVRPDDDGYTCCQVADLRNDRPRLTRRVDAVLARGLRPTAVERVGADPEDRVTVTVDGETARLWPSDHAGVVATFEPESIEPPTDASTATTDRVTDTDTSPRAQDGTQSGGPTRSDGATSTATDPPTASPSGASDGRTSSPPQSGFGPGLALLAALLTAVARRLR